MTKRQQKHAARMWIATFRYFIDHAYDMGSISEKDIDGILTEVDKISAKLLKSDPLTITLPRIVEYVTEYNK